MRFISYEKWLYLNNVYIVFSDEHNEKRLNMQYYILYPFI